MGEPLRVLIIEDSADDARLLVRRIERADKQVEWRRVDDQVGLREALQTGKWDVVLSDYALPKMEFFDAVAAVKEVDSILPIIAVSGSIGEEQTAEVLRAGVGDLVLKDRMERLVPAIERELAAASGRRKAARDEEALKLTQFAVEHASDSIIWFDLESRIIYANRSTRAMLGYSSDEITGLKITDLDSDGTADGFEKCVEGLQSDGPCTFEATYRTKSGKLLPVEVSLHYLQYGSTAMVACYSRDITERKRAESALRENEARYRELFDASPVAIWVEDYSKVKVIIDRLRNQGVDDFEQFFAEHPETLRQAIADIDIVDANPMAAQLYSVKNVDELIRVRHVWHRSKTLKPLEESYYGHEIAALANGYRRFELESEVENYAGETVGVRVVANLPETYVDTWRRLISTEEDVTERKRAEAALRDSEAFLRLIADNLPILIAYFGRDGRYRFINRTGARWYARPPEEIIGRKVEDVITPRAFQAFRPYYEMACKGVAQDFDLTVLYPDGVTRDIHVAYEPDRAPDGGILGFVAMVADITDRKTAESQLRLITDAVPVLIAYLDADARYRFVNKTGEKWYARPRKEVIGGTVATVLGREIYESVLPKLKAAADGETVVFERRLDYPDGVTRDVELTYIPHFGPDGKVDGIFSLTTDLTERKLIEHALRESEERFSSLVANITGAVYRGACDEHWTMAFMSDAIEDISGYPASDFVNNAVRSYPSITHPDDWAVVEETILNSLEHKHAYAVEYRIIDAKGDIHWVWEKGVGVFDDGGKLMFLDGTIFDVTDAKLAEEQLRQAQKMEAVGQLTGGVAHDFNNLLTVILGNARLMEQRLENGDAAAAKRLDAIVGAARRGANLTQRLLAFSRKERLEPKVVDARDLVSGMLDMMRRTLGETIKIKTHFADRPLNVLADPNLLEAALLNLATNARDAMPEGGDLKITLNAEKCEPAHRRPETGTAATEFVVFSVSDTGIGIPAEHRDKIFEPFFTTKEVGKGSGLGLSMVFGFVKQSGGHVRVKSEVGRGTTFRLFLPKIRGTSAPETDARDPEHPIANGRGTILVVEDEPGVRAVAVATLEKLGYRVIESENGPDALAKLDRHRDVDLLFTDIVMPGGMTGLDLAARARERVPGLKVLYTTGYASSENAPNGGLPKGAAVVAKPYEVADLARKVSQTLGAR